MTTRSERAWLRVRSHLREQRHELGVAAAGLYPDLPTVHGTPLLTGPQWTPAGPVPLDRIALRLDAGRAFHGVSGTEEASAAVRPVRADGTRYPRYSAAVAKLDAPAVLENRRTYRLLDADLAGLAPRLGVGLGSYFDGTDTGGAVAHEHAAGGTAFRTLVGDPLDPARRPVNLAISAVTLRLDRRRGEARFLLHRRDPAVGHAGGLHQVLPVGIFQPATDAPDALRPDLSLWRCLVREYAEEVLGADEPPADGGPVDYTGWPFARRMSEARDGGHVRAFCLGLGVDPLTLATDLLAAVVVDAPTFDDLFGAMVPANAEGEIVSAGDGAAGVPFRRAEVEHLVRRERMQAAGAAALAGAWAHRDVLLA